MRQYQYLNSQVGFNEMYNNTFTLSPQSAHTGVLPNMVYILPPKGTFKGPFQSLNIPSNKTINNMLQNGNHLKGISDVSLVFWS